MAWKLNSSATFTEYLINLDHIPLGYWVALGTFYLDNKLFDS